MAQPLRALVPTEDLSVSPACPWWQAAFCDFSSGICCPLLPSIGTRHTYCALIMFMCSHQACTQSTYTHADELDIASVWWPRHHPLALCWSLTRELPRAAGRETDSTCLGDIRREWGSVGFSGSSRERWPSLYRTVCPDPPKWPTALLFPASHF
jgi:hypothetical protein